MPAAVLLAMALLAASLFASWALSPGLLLVACVYVALQAGYTLALKHVVLLDVVCIGLGFVLRAMAGAVVVSVAISHWLVICTFTLCLFMGFSKRRCELSALAENGSGKPVITAARCHCTRRNYWITSLRSPRGLRSSVSLCDRRAHRAPVPY